MKGGSVRWGCDIQNDRNRAEQLPAISGHKTIKAFKDHTSKKNKLVDAFDKGADTLVWQGLASVVRSRSVYARAVRCPKLIQR
eukprot:889795-Rhodomonas_salina.1